MDTRERMAASVIVVGSANLDRVYRVPRIPAPGETLLATAASEHPGGKGNNQVIAVARAGAPVAFLAALGSDAAGNRLVRTLADAGVVDLTRRVDAPTGTALITVDDAGENTIVVNAGANALLTDLTAAERAEIESADYLLVQLEIPLDTVLAAARVAHAAGTTVVLNAAPICDLPGELLDLVDLLVVNEHEALILAGASNVDDSPVVAFAMKVADTLLARVASVVVTLGSAGAVVANRDTTPRHLQAHRVTAVDTTGAGDTFCGALVASLCEGRTLYEATGLAGIAAAISVQREGAVSSIPTRDEIDRFSRADGSAA